MALVGLLGLSACSASQESADSVSVATSPAPSGKVLNDFSAMETAATQGTIAASQVTLAAAAEDVPAATEAGGAPGDIDIDFLGRDVIVEVYVSMLTDDLSRAISTISSRATGLGGGVMAREINYQQLDGEASQRDGSANLIIKVPPENASALLEGLSEAGQIVSMSQSAQDVTEQLVDLEVRIENVRASIANVRGFMEQTTDLSQLVTLEGELTRRQTELEQLEARQRNIETRVALSTITIALSTDSESAPVDDQLPGLGTALSNGWHSFVDVLAVIAVILATSLPYLLGAGVIALLWRWRRQSKRRRDPATGPVSDENATLVE